MILSSRDGYPSRRGKRDDCWVPITIRPAARSRRTENSGSMAFYVMAKSAYDNCLMFEVGKVDSCRGSVPFHLSLYFACLDLERPDPS